MTSPHETLPQVGEQVVGPLSGQPCTLATLPVCRASDLAAVIRQTDGHGFTIPLRDVHRPKKTPAAANGVHHGSYPSPPVGTSRPLTTGLTPLTRPWSKPSLPSATHPLPSITKIGPLSPKRSHHESVHSLRIDKDTRPARAIVAPASLPADMVHRQLRPGERVVWVGNLTDALGLPVTWLDRKREDVLKAVADLRGRGAVAEADPVHDVLARLFLGGQPWRETCWKCGKEINPILEKCPVCGADSLPF